MKRTAKQLKHLFFSVTRVIEQGCVWKEVKILGIKFRYKDRYRTLLQIVTQQSGRLDELEEQCKTLLERTTQQLTQLEKQNEDIGTLFQCLLNDIKIPRDIEDTPITTQNDDANIYASLKALGRFLFLPNKGNLGDIMIASTEYQYFDAHHFDYAIYDISDGKQAKSPFNLVYGGGGIWNKVYHAEHPEILNIFKSKQLQKCVILSSSFNEVDEVVKTFDKRFTVFCRDVKSYEYCKSLNNRARFLLADDMVIGCDFEMYKVPFFNKANVAAFLCGFSLETFAPYMRLYRRYCSETSEVECQLSTMEDFTVGFLLREDNERVHVDHAVHPLDLSAYLAGYGCDKGYSYVCAQFLLDTINRFDIVVTNRLHIGICAAKLGKEVLLLDISTYKKAEGVYRQSLHKFKNVHMTTPESLEVDVRSLLKNNKNQTTKEHFKVESFQDFILRYASFENSYGPEKRFLDIR